MMKKRQIGWWLVLAGVVGAVGVACSSGGGDGEEGISGEEFAERYCPLLRPCCDALDPEEWSVDADLTRCRAIFSVSPADGAAAKSCVETYEAWAKEDTWCKLGHARKRPEACERAYPSPLANTGQQPLGGACEQDADCARDSRGPVTCDLDYGADEPSPFCRVLVAQPAGATCYGELGDDYHGVYLPGRETVVPVCDTARWLQCLDNVCVAPVKIGESCSNAHCVEGAYCDEGVCVAGAGLGEPCTGSETCDAMGYCEMVENVCRLKGELGDRCDYSSGCFSNYCGWNGVCVERGAPVLGVTVLCQ